MATRSQPVCLQRDILRTGSGTATPGRRGACLSYRQYRRQLESQNGLGGWTLSPIPWMNL
ncbi:hypothetical protein BDP55DRAFT_688393 [Colletotrichum godetiae]|uniref:Uncharacterized protein n=1 Tax=Colletotrichum godetiae TaxID=1209918 RepID=A0AAJ0A549_9PEZI|nr:uncharacterized protein BDP55DRAFT_688393 [Colletotrichum godetiae]KAK1656645.1 hypothetical protein BDP55DRAFT_688393 [Colletotrichum godetiae]